MVVFYLHPAVLCRHGWTQNKCQLIFKRRLSSGQIIQMCDGLLWAHENNIKQTIHPLLKCTVLCVGFILSHAGLSSPDKNKLAYLPVVWLCISGILHSAVVSAACCVHPFWHVRVRVRATKSQYLCEEKTIKRAPDGDAAVHGDVDRPCKGEPAGRGQNFLPLGTRRPQSRASRRQEDQWTDGGTENRCMLVSRW